MKLILVQVSSLDGITNQGAGEDHHQWVSKEDQDFFYKVFEEMPLIIMGSKTYEAAKQFMTHKEGRTRVILSRNPEKYKNDIVPGKLEFTNEHPLEIIKRFEEKGIKKALHVGGALANTAFFKQNLISEIWLTIEPILVGPGIGTVTEKMKVPLALRSVEKLNEKGTLLLKYAVGQA